MSFFLRCAYLDARIKSEMQRVLAPANHENGKTYRFDIQQIAVRFSVLSIAIWIIGKLNEMLLFAFEMEE